MKHTVALVAIAVVLAGAAVYMPKTALAYRGDVTVKGPNYTEERHTAMMDAFAKKDYQAWKKLVGDRGIARKITAKNFDKFAEAHNLALAGKTEEAAKIRAELGLGSRNGSGMGCAQGRSAQ